MNPRFLTALPLLIAALALAACGEGSPPSSETSGQGGAPREARATSAQTPAGGTGATPQKSAKDQHGEGASTAPGQAPRDSSASFTPRRHSDSGGGSAPLRTRGGDNSIQDFGSEAGGEDFAAAAAALHAYLDARAAGAWRTACSYMASGLTTLLAEPAAGEGSPPPDCPALLHALSAGLPKSALREAAQADVASVRVEGDRAFLLFHGAESTPYFIPMAREGGAWKVAAPAPSPLG
jgi:hypothetical protein